MHGEGKSPKMSKLQQHLYRTNLALDQCIWSFGHHEVHCWICYRQHLNWAFMRQLEKNKTKTRNHMHPHTYQPIGFLQRWPGRVVFWLLTNCWGSKGVSSRGDGWHCIWSIGWRCTAKGWYLSWYRTGLDTKCASTVKTPLFSTLKE